MLQYKFSGKKSDGISLSLVTVDKYGIPLLFFKTSPISENCYFLNVYLGMGVNTTVKNFCPQSIYNPCQILQFWVD